MNEPKSSRPAPATRCEAGAYAGTDRPAIRVGLFDDASRHGAFLHGVLTQSDYVCLDITTMKQLATALRCGTLDLLIVVGLEHDSRGIEALNWVRELLAPDVPVMFVGGPGGAQAESLALNAGADDYVVRSRSPEVLVARMASLLRRSCQPKPERLARYGVYEFDTSRSIVTLHGSTVTLTQREFDLAWLLFSHLDAPLSRAQIFESVWHQAFGLTSRTVDTHICWLRSKLRLQAANGYVIVSVHGYGYRLESVRAGDFDAPARH
ncbi:response regulator transcription factor [Paraburkholderia sp. J67]|uniref:response regulator transcription factor n=1 Tax=Paraburkholderia sp. J67 TaxID=2805435 RepID=UPI002ABE8D20|nr:response regulator transcription factor [Paraburkholderia sp. J67]